MVLDLLKKLDRTVILNTMHSALSYSNSLRQYKSTVRVLVYNFIYFICVGWNKGYNEIRIVAKQRVA